MTDLRRVLGIDPGLAATGFGVVDGDARGAATAITMGAIRTRRQRSRPERLGEIFDRVGELIDEHHPDELAIELQYVSDNVRSAMTIGEARAAALVAAATRGLPVYEYQPAEVKESVTGYGGAPKEQVREMVKVHVAARRLGRAGDRAHAARRAAAGGGAGARGMIAALRGTLAAWDESSATLWLDVGGVTYELIIPAFATEWIERIEPDGELSLFTYYHVSDRNPRPVLIGFPRLAEREFFRKFIDVPDVGPTKAVRALARPVSEIARWIEAGDTQALQQLPGIGTRLAQTIVARLRGRLVQEALLRDEVEGAEAAVATDLRGDAVDALMALQYGRREAEAVVNDAMAAQPEVDDLEALLRSVLEQQAPAP
jgi:crossover junction endodeoxyribonuclease RuvC